MRYEGQTGEEHRDCVSIVRPRVLSSEREIKSPPNAGRHRRRGALNVDDCLGVVLGALPRVKRENNRREGKVTVHYERCLRL